MNKKILNKKGTSTIETIILAPIVIYIFMLVIFKSFQVFMYGKIEQKCYDITRNVIVRSTFREGLDVIANEYMKGLKEDEPVDSEYIKSITLTDKDGKNETITFENGEFNDYIEINNGTARFKYGSWNNSRKSKMEELWTYETRISIEYECNISKTMKINSSVEIFNPQTQEKETFVFGGNKISSTCENILMFDTEG